MPAEARSVISVTSAPAANNYIEKVRLVANGSLTSTAGGFIVNTLGMNPSGTSEWGSYSTIFDQFRVLAVRLTLIPKQVGTITTTNSLVVAVFDNDDTTALGSLNAALEYATARPFGALWNENQSGPKQITWARPVSGRATAIDWIDVAVPANSLGSIKFYSDTLTASITYFEFSIEYFTEFRGRR
jgi:hypothetical protein